MPRPSGTWTGCAPGSTRTPTAVRAVATDGFTALHLAAFFGKVEAARTLLEAGADVATYGTNAFANQPLHAAAAGRHHEVCRLLLGAGADVEATQHGGFRPLHEAAHGGDVELVELFLSAGADPTAITDEGRTPADLAEGAGPPRPRPAAARGRRWPRAAPDLASLGAGREQPIARIGEPGHDGLDPDRRIVDRTGPRRRLEDRGRRRRAAAPRRWRCWT